MVKRYHKGLWNLYSRFESWPASSLTGVSADPVSGMERLLESFDFEAVVNGAIEFGRPYIFRTS